MGFFLNKILSFKSFKFSSFLSIYRTWHLFSSFFISFKYYFKPLDKKYSFPILSQFPTCICFLTLIISLIFFALTFTFCSIICFICSKYVSSILVHSLILLSRLIKTILLSILHNSINIYIETIFCIGTNWCLSGGTVASLFQRYISTTICLYMFSVR